MKLAADTSEFLSCDLEATLRMPASDEVTVWCARLDQPASRVGSLRPVLAEDERARADRFHFEKDRTHFTVARATLRTILGGCLGIDPRQLQFSYSHYGKPSLATGSADDRLRFNVSHSGGMALFALSNNRELGVDIEFIRPDIEHDRIAERFFSPREVSVLLSLPEALRTEAFFNCWTRKEAYIKARGEGLSFPLDQFDVSLRPGEPAALLETLGDAGEAARWRLHAMDPREGYAAAIAVEGKDWRLNCWRWPDYE